LNEVSPFKRIYVLLRKKEEEILNFQTREGERYAAGN
jgi:hypothetical protein